MKKFYRGISVAILALALVAASLLSANNSVGNLKETQDVPAVSAEGAALSSSTTVPSDFTVSR